MLPGGGRREEAPGVGRTEEGGNMTPLKLVSLSIGSDQYQIFSYLLGAEIRFSVNL